MSLFEIKDGHYDRDGYWVRDKYCLVPCPVGLCTCRPPNGVTKLEGEELKQHQRDFEEIDKFIYRNNT